MFFLKRKIAPSTVRPLARNPLVLIRLPLPLGFGLGGRSYWHGVGGFVFDSPSPFFFYGKKRPLSTAPETQNIRRLNEKTYGGSCGFRLVSLI